MSEPTEPAPEKVPEIKSEPPAYSEAAGEKPATTESIAPAAAETDTAETDTKAPAPAAEAKKPYEQLLAELGAMLKEADYDEVYGLKLSPSGDLHTSIILQVCSSCQIEIKLHLSEWH